MTPAASPVELDGEADMATTPTTPAAASGVSGPAWWRNMEEGEVQSPFYAALGWTGTCSDGKAKAVAEEVCSESECSSVGG